MVAGGWGTPATFLCFNFGFYQLRYSSIKSFSLRSPNHAIG